MDPAAAPADRSAETGGPLPPAPARRVALVVDDEATVAALLARVLGAQGWHAIVTTAPDDAAALAQQVDVDLLVTDLEMPGMSALDLTARLRQQRAGLPVVLVSGRPDAADLVLDPPFAFVSKPFRIHGILEAVASLFGDSHRVDGATATATA
jgi:DNA-binding response OmpR family regulator